MEKKVIHHLYHEHSLILTENVCDADESVDCYGCGGTVANREMAYVCMQENCSNKTTLHKKCGELPSQISLLKHPHNPLRLFDFHYLWNTHYCDVCGQDIYDVLGYRCSRCDFDVDITCEIAGIYALLEEEREVLQHPSHPDHPLTLMRKPAATFYCDGCGAEDVDMAFICSSCEFWVHKKCALSPLTRHFDLHHHQLSLAFSFPMKHRKYYDFYKCEVCDQFFDITSWVYFCGDCRYFVHLKCIGSTTKQNIKEDNGCEGMIKFPLDAHDVSKELITRFVMREQGLDRIPDTASDQSFLDYHDHPLSLVLESSSHQDKDDDDDDDDDDDADELKRICEACVTHISSPPYYECVSCKYFIHFICSLLPKTISSSPLTLESYYRCPKTPNESHKFRLFASSTSSIHKDFIKYRCAICDLYTNGMGYDCGDCWTKMDVKCASLPTTITHAFHSHKSLLLTRIPEYKGRRIKQCGACLNFIDSSRTAYCCSIDDCNFVLEQECAQLPMSVMKREWDQHPLLLTSEASLDHPSDFYCEFCETEIHPKIWMYHCRQCDVSFHTKCLENASSSYRNIKLGRRFNISGIHPHPLTFNYITLSKRCHICDEVVYSYRGFECASCYYVVCQKCGCRELGIT